jgi:hypothetical protein
MDASSSGNTTIWEAAKHEWTRHICNLLVPIIQEGFQNIYTNCQLQLAKPIPKPPKQEPAESVDGEPEVVGSPEEEDDEQLLEIPEEGVITSFQQTLRNIPQWNQEIIESEYNRILESINTEYNKMLGYENCTEVLDDLIKAAFTSHILILSSVNLTMHPERRIDMQIPSSKRFVHKVYIEAARSFYRMPHLFSQHYSGSSGNSEYKQHKNAARVEQVLCQSVEEAIRKLMPIKTILRAYFTTAAGNDDAGAAAIPPDEPIDEVEDITRRVSPRSRRGLKRFLRRYIETTSKVITSADDDEEKNASSPRPIKVAPTTSKEDKSERHSVIEDVTFKSNAAPDSQEVMVVDHFSDTGRADSLMRRRTTTPSPPRNRLQSVEEENDNDDGGENNDLQRDLIELAQVKDPSINQRSQDPQMSIERQKHNEDREHREQDRDRDRDHRKRDNRKRDRQDEPSRHRFHKAEEEEDHHHKTRVERREPTPARPKAPRRPRSVEFRLARADEEENDKDVKKPHVTYKAPEKDMAFFPDLNSDENSSDLPPPKKKN